ncbi:hypothetical protein LTR10_005193 [Elasticomyces elasticus]|nr:hypothetical protein LTR10_005193 [Elasticomyces elasticus]
MLPWRYLGIFVTSFVGGLVALVKLGNVSLATAYLDLTLVATFYLLGTFSSLVVYRVWLAPISKFPGPWQARVSSLWWSFTTSGTETYGRLGRMHEDYGHYVRIGSNDLSITDPAIVDAAFSASSKVRKSQWYDAASPYDSLHTTRSRALHDRRRRVWAPGFSDRALREYEVHVQMFNDKLMERIRQHGGGGINVSKWFMLYSFDVMGKLGQVLGSTHRFQASLLILSIKTETQDAATLDPCANDDIFPEGEYRKPLANPNDVVAFGRNYGMLDSGELHWALEIMTKAMSAAPSKVPVWFMRIMVALPGVMAEFFKFLEFGRLELKWRTEHKNPEPDIAGWLLKAYEGVARPWDDFMFQGDARLIIVAGSDTTSACLTYLFYLLANRPDEVRKLRDELRPLTSKPEWSDKDIKNAPHLNGAINESLRMHPPVPSGVQRITPEEGLQVGETFIPGGTHFWASL